MLHHPSALDLLGEVRRGVSEGLMSKDAANLPKTSRIIVGFVLTEAPSTNRTNKHLLTFHYRKNKKSITEHKAIMLDSHAAKVDLQFSNSAVVWI